MNKTYHQAELLSVCSLPSGFKKSTALLRKACMDIRLCQGYATSTPEQQHEHLEKWLRRLQKQMSGEPNSSITAAFSEYEVRALLA
jgi:hypothetical protein